MQGEIVLDTETTGVDNRVDRIIEVAAMEVEGLRETGRVFHRFYDPGREIPQGATDVHGMTWDDLKGKPEFKDEAAELAEFIAGRTLVIHNAPFDIGFLNAEFRRAGVKPVYGEVIDTLQRARLRHPGASVNLDALCERYGIDRSGRTKHGGLIDVRLLFQVWIRLSDRDRLSLDAAPIAATVETVLDAMPESARQAWFPDRRAAGLGQPSEADEAAHAAFVEKMAKKSKGPPLWAGL